MADLNEEIDAELARMMIRLYNAHSSALTVVEQLTPILEGFGLIEDGRTQTDRIAMIALRAKGG